MSLPPLDRALLLGGVIGLVALWVVVRHGWRFLRSVWRRLRVRSGLPYLKHSISSHGGVALLGLAGVLFAGLLVFADLSLRRMGRLDADVVDVGRLSVARGPGTVTLALEPSPTTPFGARRVTVSGDRWRLTGTVVQFAEFWRLLGLVDGYRIERLEGAAGPRGRPGDWSVGGEPFLDEDPWVAVLGRLAGPVPGMRVLPHATAWETAREGTFSLVVTPSGYAFVEEPGP